MRRWTWTFIVLIVLLMIVACSKDDSQEAENDLEEIVMTDEERLPADKIVVTINGNEAIGSTYNQMYLQIKKLALGSSAGEKVDADELKALTIDSIINKELFIQLAEQREIVISDEQVVEKLKEIKKVNNVGYEKMREQFNDADEAIESQLKFELARREYINQYVQVDVTDEEIEKTYNELKEQIDEIKGLDSIKDELKKSIEIQKIDKKLNDAVAKFKKNSEIEVHI